MKKTKEWRTIIIDIKSNLTDTEIMKGVQDQLSIWKLYYAIDDFVCAYGDRRKIGVNKKEYFSLPYMELSRDDSPLLKKLDDEQMQRIANKLGAYLAQGWDDIIPSLIDKK